MASQQFVDSTYEVRLDRLRGAIDEQGLGGVILAPGPNLRYYTGINSFLLERPFLMLIPKGMDPHLVAPKLEAGPYERGPVKITVHSWTDSEGPTRALDEALRQVSLGGRWGLEGSVPFRFFHALTKHANFESDNADSVLQAIRATKGPEEMKQIQRAASILSNAFEDFPKLIKPGMTEVELAKNVGAQIVSRGAESVDDILVQSGAMAADPHHLPSAKKIRRKESVVIDATCTFGGYFADITRTFMIGIDRDFERIYDSVLEAQEAAIQASANNVTVGLVDSAARESLRGKSLDSFFIHRTGHGLGLEVHEAPYIVPGGTERLRPSMVFTVEPGVYLPAKVGVRIEDNITITATGNKNLTRALPKQLGWWRS